MRGNLVIGEGALQHIADTGRDLSATEIAEAFRAATTFRRIGPKTRRRYIVEGRTVAARTARPLVAREAENVYVLLTAFPPG